MSGMVLQQDAPTRKRLRLLLSAYACEPGRGSEPEVGWRWANLMAQEHDVTVITRANNRSVIEAALAQLPAPHPRFIYHDPSAIWVRLKKKGMPNPIFYLLWQIGARLRMRGSLEAFDLIHHVTFNSFSRPGFWWGCGKPVLLGPLGGGQVAPWQMLALFRKTKLKEILRSLYVMATPLYPPFLLSCAYASAILVANADTERRIPSWWRRKTTRFLETGVTPEEVQNIPTPSVLSSDAVRIIWVSRFDEIKAPVLAIRAFEIASKQDPRLHLTMIGDGPDYTAAVAIIEELNLARRVMLTGKMLKEEIPAHLGRHDLFLFTSLRDTSGNVLIEAMAVGLPSVCLCHHGAAEITTNETSIRVIPAGIEDTTKGLAEAILSLASSEDQRREMGRKARARVEELFLWPRKALYLDAVYRRIVAEYPGRKND